MVILLVDKIHFISDCGTVAKTELSVGRLARAISQVICMIIYNTIAMIINTITDGGISD